MLVTLAAVAAPASSATTPSRPIGASGSVAALSGSSMEVQNPSSGQTTVSWTPTTTFSETVSKAVSNLAAGDCVSVTGTESKKSKTTIAARSISVTTPTSSGSCTSFGGARTPNDASGARRGGGFAPRGGGGFGGGAGFGSGSTSGSRPSFPGGGSGSSNFRKQLASLAIASGKVTEVHGSTVTVSGIKFSLGSFSGRGSTNSKTSKNKKPVAPKKEKLTIATSSSTTVSSTQSAASTDLAVGDCVSAFGPGASNGAVTATTVRITSTGGTSCTGGSGRFPGGGGFFGGGGFPGEFGGSRA
jgi:hypothetical protein